jgi:RHH-type proline utilization regulon transcriptional repressor/proline dehydrogenase/delta 1-pyrroline-5-carboxylate dehydrogenase
MLAGAMAELTLGDPALLATDVGPVIDADSQAALQRHADRLERDARPVFCCAHPAGLDHGNFFAPRAYEIDSARRLHREVFGPILHVVRWRADRLDAVLDEIEATGYALTFGIHSRVDATVQHVLRRLGVGNSYVNRNMIGAVVGVQPFGGERLSGTGPKAGGPRYLHRFATERTISVDLTAAGGNAALLSMDEPSGS